MNTKNALPSYRFITSNELDQTRFLEMPRSHLINAVKILMGIYEMHKDRIEIVQELSEFLGLHPKIVKRLIPCGAFLSSKEWRERVKTYEIEELYSFYSSSMYYLFDLAYANYWSINTYLGMIVVAVNAAGRVLDYGGGVGSQLIKAWEMGLRDLTYYDIKGLLFEFAKYRFKRRGMKVRMIEASEKEDRLEGYYDTIICKEVLEHVKNPLLHLERIDKHLIKGGRLFLTWHFEKEETHPMHFNHRIDIDEALKNKGYRRKILKLLHIVPIRIHYYIKQG